LSTSEKFQFYKPFVKKNITGSPKYGKEYIPFWHMTDWNIA